MASSITGRASGVGSSADASPHIKAMKAPVAAATTANITLNDTQTVDGTALSAGDRVLVKNQTDQTENGIYDVVASGDWTRSPDFSQDNDVLQGTLVYVAQGTVSGGMIFGLTTANDVAVGTDNIVFALRPIITLTDNVTGELPVANMQGHSAAPAGTFLKQDGTWAATAGSGDMLIATYDPTAVSGDAFDMDNMVQGSTNFHLTSALHTLVSALDSDMATFAVPASTTISAFGATLVDDADAGTARTTLGLVIGTNVQAYDAQLDDVSGLAVTDGGMIVGDGANFVLETGATLRTSMGLGTANDVAFAGLTASAQFALSGDISPSEITANQNDYAPTGHATASTFRVTSDAERTITGLDGGSDGRIVILHNIGSNNIILADESASSTAAMRFSMAADLTIGADKMTLLQYDSTSSRWRVLQAAASAGTVDTSGTPAATQLAVFTDADTVAGYAGLLWDNGTTTLTVTGSIAGATIDADSNTLQNISPDEFDTDTADTWAAFDGMAFDKGDLTVLDASGLKLDIEKNGGGDMDFWINGAKATLDCTAGSGAGGRARVSLTAGADANNPQINHIYVTRSGSTATLAASTSLPTGAFAWVGKVSVPDTTTFATTGAYLQQRYTEAFANDSRGLHSHTREKLRALGAVYISGGGNQSVDITTNGGSEDNVHFSSDAASVHQLHRQSYPAFSTGPYYLGNGINQYGRITDLNAADDDQSGNAITNNDYTNWIIWGAVNEEVGDCKLFVNLPSDFYANQADALADASATADYTVPDDFRSVAFLLARVVIEYETGSSGTWKNETVFSLLGQPPGVRSGGTGVAAASTEFADSTFKIYDNLDITKIFQMQMSGLTTGNTRTMTVPDTDFTISSWVAANLLDDANAAAVIGTLGLDADLATFALPASTTISAFGATLVDDADAGTAIATLGLDADLATFALPASTTISAFGASLVDDAAATNARTTLGLVIGTDVMAVEQEINTQSGTSYTLVIGDTTKCVRMTNAAANTVTIPANASVAYPVGTRIYVEQAGAGQTTIAITSDTLNSKSGNVDLAAQYTKVELHKVASTTWDMFGDLVA